MNARSFYGQDNDIINPNLPISICVKLAHCCI